jgi:hypothetical protein
LINSNEAYLLGLLYGKGSISESNNRVQLIFKIKFRKPSVDSVRTDNIHHIPKHEISRSIESVLLYDFQILKDTLKNQWDIDSSIIINRTEADVWNKKEVILKSDFINKNHIRLCEIFNVTELNHEILFDFPDHLNIEDDRQLSLGFVQGVCDAACLPPTNASSSYGSSGNARIQIEPSQSRWTLPINLCRIFQLGLNIPVNNINWGHPQIRTSWKHQNHQFRVSLKDVPTYYNLFRLNFKQNFYNDLYNKSNVEFVDDYENRKCPLKKRVKEGEIITIERKTDSDDLSNDLLHENLKDIDINVSGKKSIIVCRLLGCTQCDDYYDVIIEPEAFNNE